jgi:WS/DGAT/MGAT family acyltransferase
MTSKPMSPVDAAWYHFDGPMNAAVITSIVLTRKRLDFEQVKALYAQRLAPFERFRCRVVESALPLTTPHWEEVPGFEIGQQLHHVALPPPGDKAALMDLISDLASTPLDHSRPLWDVHVVDRVGRGAALITRMHHCIADGTANLLVARALFDTSPDAAAPAAASQRRPPAPGLVERLFAPAIEFAEHSYGQLRLAVDTVADVVTHPQRTLKKGAVALAGAGMLATELMRKPDPQSPLKGEFGLGKRVAWSDPVPLTAVKAIGAPLGAKINDVLVAGMTGALRGYLKKRGSDVDHMTVRAMVPVDLRPPQHAQELGNEFGLVLLELAIGKRDPLARLRLTKERMDALKRSPEPIAALALFGILGRAPKTAQDFAVRLFESKASVVMTNVAGPKEPLYLAGVPIDRVMFWVPHPGEELGMGISILSYRGSATLAVIADAHLVPDPEVITERFQREFAALQAAVRRRAAKKAAAVVPRRSAMARAGRSRRSAVPRSR